MTETTQAERNAQNAWTYAINCVMQEDTAHRLGRTPEDIIMDYATDVLGQIGADRARLGARPTNWLAR